jgi:hypothetical protein
VTRPAVTILTSGVGLGVYIPALLIQRQLCQLGCTTDVEVLESYYTPERRQAHLAHRDAHHASFALAQMAHRMVRDVQDCLDPARTGLLIDRWIAQGRDRFIVWSGFWLPLIERYRQLRGGALHVDHCRIDADISASFKIYPHLQDGNSIWLWNWEERRIVHEVPVKATSPIPFCSREDRLVVHGGGWGIGSYREKAAELNNSGYALDLIIHDMNEAGSYREKDRCFMLEPFWRAWNKTSDGVHEFPPMGEVVDSGEITYKRNPDYHPLYDVIRRSKGIVSKPGGCTLIDSLSSATPVVLLEPYGYAEKSNGQIWKYLGFGIPYEEWRKTGYSMSVLEKLHLNLLTKAGNGIDYPQAYAARVMRG